MTSAAGPIYITLDPPYRLEVAHTNFLFLGWAEVDDLLAPDIRLSLNGVETPVQTYEKGGIQKYFPGMKALGFSAKVDFSELFKSMASSEVAAPFLVEARVTSDGRSRVFEYAVADAWLLKVFGRPIKARPIPPEALQIRVAGAAAGEFHATGRRTADQISTLLRNAGVPLPGRRRILDFGAGPGRVTACIHELNPTAKLTGSDIDPEAIAWAQANLEDVGVFRVNGVEPPAPFADEAFDLIYAISVFTHMPEDLQWAWLADLRRMLKPGGVLLTTKLNYAAYDLPEAIKAEGARTGFVYWGDAAATDGLPEFYRLAYHSEDYVRREWGRYFEILHVGAHDLNDTQDAVVMRRPAHALSWLPRGLRKILHQFAH